MMAAETASNVSSRPIVIEPFQQEAWRALGSPADSVLLYGGAGSGKTVVWMLWLILRALSAPKATHAILRHTFNSLRGSIIEGTLPWVCERYWPGQQIYRLDKTAWFAEFKNGGRIWFGGLDSKERAEKILGQDHSTVVLNEISQISYASAMKAATRLRQNRGLRNKLICDENPPMVGHWSERVWIAGIEPTTGKKTIDRAAYASVMMHPKDNPYIPESIKIRLQNMPPRDRLRFWDGQFGTGAASPLWTYESIGASKPEAFHEYNVTPETLPSGVGRIVVAVDPSGCHGPEDKRSDEVGISVVGVDDKGRPHVLEDASGRMGPNGPEGWGAKVCAVFHKWGADTVVGETNYGGAMVGANIGVADRNIPFREVTASRGKSVRAGPVSTLFGLGKAFLCGNFPELEAQLVQFSADRYTGDRSPDRADAMIWGCYALGVVQMPGQGHFDYMRQQAEHIDTSATIAGEPLGPEHIVFMRAPTHISGTVYSLSGTAYEVVDGVISAKPEDAEGLRGIGFVEINAAT